MALPSAEEAASLRARHLIYLDGTRTHEVHAEIATHSRGVAFITTEFPAGSRDPHEAVQLNEILATPHAAVSRIADLESRLTATGEYWRADAADMAWAKVNATAPKGLDMRAHEFPLPGATNGAKIRFHHFHGTDKDTLYVSMPRQDSDARHILAQLEFQFPQVDEAEVDILHARLAPQLLQSSLVREHIDMPRKGFAKLVEPVHYQKAYGAGWQAAASNTFRTATAILLGRRPTRLVEEAPRGPASTTSELDRALASETVRDTVNHFLNAEKEDELVRGGEFHIRRFINTKRRYADHRDQWRLSILEAVLLIKWAGRAGKQDVIDLEGGKLIRHARA